MRKIARNIMFLSMLGLLLGLSSCHHKDLMYEEPLTQEVDVVFDWRNAPEGNPKSMALYLYNRATGERLRFIFTDKNGGRIRIPFGMYDAIGMNSDNEDWALLKNTEDIDGFETYTQEISKGRISTVVNGGFTERFENKENEKWVNSPDHLYTGRTDGFELKVTDKRKTLVIYPEDVVCHYTVEITDIINGEALENSTVDASLSDLAEGFMNGKRTTSVEKETIPFELKFAESNEILRGDFLTFGVPVNKDNRNILTVYFRNRNGELISYEFDVTNQVNSAPDPKNVLIKLKGLKIPDESVPLGGVTPEVNEWESEHIDIRMKN